MDTIELLRITDAIAALEDKVKKAFLELYRQPPKMESDSTKELAAALSKAQGEVRMAFADKIGGHHKNPYASLKETLKAAYPALSKNGLSIEVKLIQDNGQQFFRAILRHSSGEWTASEMLNTFNPKNNHEMGSNFTYARRQLISALVGLASTDEEDDDAEATMSEIRKEEDKGLNLGNYKPAKGLGYETLSQDQYDEIITELKSIQEKYGDDEAKRLWASIKGYNQINELKDLAREDYRGVVDKIRHLKNVLSKTK